MVILLSLFHLSWQDAKGGVFAKLWKKVKDRNTLVDDYLLTLRRLVNSSDLYAHVGDMNGILQYMYSIKRCEWRLIPEMFFPSGFAIALPKGSPFNKLISKE